jgi:hypothetical protein
MKSSIESCSFVDDPSRQYVAASTQPNWQDTMLLESLLLEVIQFGTIECDATKEVHVWHYKRGNSGNVSQGRCGGGAPYCGPRGARFN